MCKPPTSRCVELSSLSGEPMETPSGYTLNSCTSLLLGQKNPKRLQIKCFYKALSLRATAQPPLIYAATATGRFKVVPKISIMPGITYELMTSNHNIHNLSYDSLFFMRCMCQKHFLKGNTPPQLLTMCKTHQLNNQLCIT